MGADELPEAGPNELLADYLRASADLHDVAGDRGAHPAIIEVTRRRAQEAEEAYLRARRLPADDE
jgi:hypothetical protein